MNLFLKLSQKKWILVFLGLCLISLSYIVVSKSISEHKGSDPLKIAESFHQQCQTNKYLSCLKPLITNYAKKNPFENTHTVLSELKKINPQVKVCHPLAHAVAIEEVSKSSSNWQQVFEYLPFEECAYGYIHGAIEGKYRLDSDFKVDSKTINEICNNESLNKKHRGGGRNCSHAFGHVLLIQEQGQIEQSLEICRNTLEDFRQYCFQGVFMENFTKSSLSEHGLAELPTWNQEFLEQQVNICNKYENQEQIECWGMLSLVITKVINANNSESIKQCKNAYMVTAQDECIMESLGHNTLENFKKGQMYIDSTMCEYYEADQVNFKKCVEKVVNNILLSSKELMESVNTFCSELPLFAQEACQRRMKSFK